MKTKYLLGILLVLFCLNTFSQVTTDTMVVEYDNDTYVRSNMATTNFNTDINMFFYIASTQIYRTFIQFDLASIPENAIITSSKLVLTPAWINNAASHPAYLSRVSGSWDGTSITWNNQPGVHTSDQISITHAQTQNLVPHEFTVTSHVQKMVNYPDQNFGWCLRLQSEATPNRGVQYRTSATDSVHWHPYLIINYVLPVEVAGIVGHCTNGNDNGTITPTIGGGSGTYSSYEWFHYDMGTVTSIESGTNMSNIDIDSLEDGLYLLTVVDNLGYRGYKYFLVGEYGASTTVDFRNNSSSTNSQLFNEDASPSYIVGSSDGTTQSGNSTASYAYNSTSIYYSTLMKYNVDFDSLFDVTVADLRLYSWGHYRHTSPATTDSGYVSRVTDSWYESIVNWNTKPTKTATDRQLIPPTSPSGSVVTRHDTVDLLPFVEYWQENPDENFGVDISLTQYGQPANAYLRYRSYDYTTASQRPSLLLTFSLPEQITTVFNDSTGVGTISLLAPNGELPYKFLISTVDTLPVLNDIWNEIKDSLALDSASFFQGQFNTHYHLFENLPADRYFLAVYDNQGQKIFDHQLYLKPALRTADSTDIIISGDTLFVDSPATSARVVHFDAVGLEEDGGAEIEITQLDDDIIVGFNNFSEPKVMYEGDFEYAIKVESSGTVTFLKNGSTLGTSSAALRDQFRMLKIGNFIYFYKNGNRLQQDEIDESQEEDFKTEIQLKGPDANVMYKPFGLVKPTPHVRKTDAICGENLGKLAIYPGTHHGYELYAYSLVNSLTDIEYTDGSIGSSTGAVIDNVPVGIYNLITYWSNGSTSISSVSEIVIGYRVHWIEKSNITESIYPSNTISPTVHTTWSTSPGFAKSLNTIEYVDDYWLQFSQIYPVNESSFTFYDIRNLNGDIEARIVLFRTLTVTYAAFMSSAMIWEPLETGVIYAVNPYAVQLPSNVPLRIMHSAGEITISYQGVDLVVFDSGVTGLIRADVSMYGWVMTRHSIASFCFPIASPYVKLRRTIDGGYYLANEGILNVEYDEEYNDDELEFYVYQETGNNEVGESSWTTSPISYGDNRLSFSFTSTTCLPNGFYILEIVNKKKEKRYLRFQIVNSTC